MKEFLRMVTLIAAMHIMGFVVLCGLIGWLAHSPLGEFATMAVAIVGLTALVVGLAVSSERV